MLSEEYGEIDEDISIVRVRMNRKVVKLDEVGISKEKYTCVKEEVEEVELEGCDEYDVRRGGHQGLRSNVICRIEEEELNGSKDAIIANDMNERESYMSAGMFTTADHDARYVRRVFYMSGEELMWSTGQT